MKNSDQDNKPKFDVSKIDAQLAKWRERLIDLTKGNPLLGVNRSRVSKLQVKTPEPTAIFGSIVLQAQALKMPLVKRKSKKKRSEPTATEPEEDEQPEYILDPGDIEFTSQPKDLFRLLRRIYDNGKTTVEERGVTTLHLTFGVLNWDDPLLGESSSPLLMVPCQLESHGSSTHMRLKMTDEELQVNPALELFLRERHHISLPQLPDEPTDTTLTQFFEQVKAVVSEQGWQVEDQSWLSTFSFESLVIYKDLLAMAGIAHENPIIAAFARAGSVQGDSESLGEELDEIEGQNVVPIPVMPADASQLRALAVAGQNNHLVIHGPPGTGKSQTITNLIADALGQGKKVLFVSAKMAALDVVYDRLQKLGLDRYCLEAHSTKAGKAKIIEELKRTLETPINGHGAGLEEQLAELKRVRTQLNEYVREIHRKREPLGKTIYQIIGKVEKLHNYPLIEFQLPWDDVLETTREQLSNKLEVLDSLSSQSDIFDDQHSHPWRGFVAAGEKTAKTDAVKKNLQHLLDVLKVIDGSLNKLDELLIPKTDGFTPAGLRMITDTLQAISLVTGLPRGWVSMAEDKLVLGQKLFEDATSKSKLFETLIVGHRGTTNLGAKELHAVLEPLDTEFVSWTRVLKSSFWKWKADLRKHLLPGVSNSYPALRSYIKRAVQIEEIENWFTANNKGLSEHISAPLGNSGRLYEMAVQFYAAQKLRVAINAGYLSLPKTDPSISNDTQVAAKTIVEHLSNEDLTSAISFIDQNWPKGFVDKKSVEENVIQTTIAHCDELLSSMQKMHEWVVYQSVLDKCISEGLEPLLQALLGQSSARDVSRIFEKRFFTVWAETALDTAPALREFAGSIREEKIQHFKSLDAKIQLSTLRHIQAMAAEPTKKVTGAQTTSVQGASEIGILRRELQRRRRIKPLRKLFEEIPHVLQAIKPCMLMSPLSVSTFLKPGSISFDLVVFDEASQLPTQEAIPAILRAKQVVVAGDENQLPPTSFFMASTIFEEEEDDTKDDYEPLESLLDDCVAVAPVFKESKIVWHYRSKDERLIKFSNHYFYNNSLITFPSTTTSDEGRGVHLYYTEDGIWDRGKSRTNRIEAYKVANIVIDQLQKYPERSIGVVSMNASQKEAIDFAIDEMVANKPELQALLDKGKQEPYFVKSLENVQGDERDTMVISVGYAKTADGALSLNFGPLNREGGWRRLNVLVTRAKWQTILVTSIQSHELGAISPNNKGAIMMRNFIEYAEHGAKLPADPVIATDEETNDFEEAVAAALRDRGLIVDEQVGASGYRIDLAIRDSRDKNRYVMAVECDGATYHSARTARDRDMLRQEVLHSHGWKIHRLWSTDWFRDREKAIAGVLRSLEIAHQVPARESVQAPVSAATQVIDDAEMSQETEAVAPSVVDQAPATNKKYAAGTPYIKYPGRGADQKMLLNSSRTPGLADVIARIVQAESPIHESLIAERLKDMYRVSRAGANIQRNIESAIRLASARYRLERDEMGFVHKDDMHAVGFRTPGDGIERSLSQIAPDEIENAILFLVEDQFGFAKEQLPKAVLELFQIGRLRSEPTEIILSAADRLVRSGALRLNGYTLYLN